MVVPPAGSIIQITIGMNTGRAGIVIGVRGSSESPILVVFYQDNRLDVCVLPEMVKVLHTPEPGQVTWLTNDEISSLFDCR